MVGAAGRKQSEWAVLYRTGDVPGLDIVRRQLEGGVGPAGVPIFACEPIADSRTGYPALECTVAGISFDVAEIAFLDEVEQAGASNGFGVNPDMLAYRSGLSIIPSPHIAAAAQAMPVVRAGAMLADRISLTGDPTAVVWWPAASAMEPVYFRKIVDEWLAGGAFPGLGLIAFNEAPDGGLHSTGLAFFTGQELRIEPPLAERGAEALKLGARIVDRLVLAAPVDDVVVIETSTGGSVRLSPSANGRFVVVSDDS